MSGLIMPSQIKQNGSSWFLYLCAPPLSLKLVYTQTMQRIQSCLLRKEVLRKCDLSINQTIFPILAIQL